AVHEDFSRFDSTGLEERDEIQVGHDRKAVAKDRAQAGSSCPYQGVVGLSAGIAEDDEVGAISDAKVVSVLEPQDPARIRRHEPEQVARSEIASLRGDLQLGKEVEAAGKPRVGAEREG